jgi:site-specific recombinase XerD
VKCRTGERVKAFKDAKVASFSGHRPGHTFASRLVIAGLDIRTLQGLLGQKIIGMTVLYSALRRSIRWQP